jgi:uncharacterized protein
VEAGSLSALVDATLSRAWRRDSPWHGEHHWRCVTATGLGLATESRSADATIVFCFGLLHDTRRENEAVDPGHGGRAAVLAGELRAEGLLALDADRFGVLVEALAHHSDGRISADPTVGTCWDADRLHLPRVSIEPDAALLSTPTAHTAGRVSAASALRVQGPPAWAELVGLVPARTG